MHPFETTSLVIDPSEITEGSVKWKSPSNIALVKYWGKYGQQLPDNASLSLTLTEAHTITEMTYGLRKDMSLPVEFTFEFEGAGNVDFSSRIEKFLVSVLPLFPFLSQISLKISSENSFPHSSGIASSASAMSAMALCLCSIETTFFDTLGSDEEFERKASYAARLGSGSASRSVYSYASIWGSTQFANMTLDKDITGSDEYAIPIADNIHPVFHTFRDTILIVDSGQKSVSSSAGHKLMETHRYREVRKQNAQRNLENLILAMQKNNINDFVNIVEKEAMELHALMMTSTPSYMLMAPNTLEIIKRIINYRNTYDVPVCFTLDAGPNVHMLYPEKYIEEMERFIVQELLMFCEDDQILYDHVGIGPIEL